MTLALNPEITRQPVRDPDMDSRVWRAHFRDAYNTLCHHLAEVVPGRTYESKDEAPNNLGYEASVVITLRDGRIFVPDFQLEDEKPHPTVGAIGIFLRQLGPSSLPWNGPAGVLLWWFTQHPELDCAPWELVGAEDEDRLYRLFESSAYRR